MIGMMLLKGEWERDYYANPDTFGIGCAGKISQLVKLPDGRFNLVLTGLSEFRVVRENRDRSFRQAEVEWCPVEPPMNIDAEAMEGLRQLLFEYLGDNGRGGVEIIGRARLARGRAGEFPLFSPRCSRDREADAPRSARRTARLPLRCSHLQAGRAQAWRSGAAWRTRAACSSTGNRFILRSLDVSNGGNPVSRYRTDRPCRRLQHFPALICRRSDARRIQEKGVKDNERDRKPTSIGLICPKMLRKGSKESRGRRKKATKLHAKGCSQKASQLRIVRSTHEKRCRYLRR